MKNTKKMLSLLLAVIMVLCAVPMTAGAVSYTGTCGAQGSNLTWEIDPDTATLYIRGTGDMENYDTYLVSRPKSPPWNEYLTFAGFSYIVIEDGVTSIGDFAFRGTNATNITIGRDVNKVGIMAFPRRATVTVSKSNDALKTDKNGNIFSDGGKILTYVNPKNCTDGFYTIPYGVESLARCAFADARYYEMDSITVYVPETVRDIPRSAFTTVTNIANGDIDYDAMPKLIVDEDNPYYSSDEYGILFDKNKEILYSAPSGEEYDGLYFADYTIPETVKEIADYAFWGYDHDSSVYITDNVTTIGSHVFDRWRGGKAKLYIPKSVTKLADDFVVLEDYNQELLVYYEGTEAEWNNLYHGSYYPESVYDEATGKYIDVNKLTVYFEHQHVNDNIRETCTNTMYECIICETVNRIEANGGEHKWILENRIDDCGFGGELHYYCSECYTSNYETVSPKVHEFEDYPDVSGFCGEIEFELRCKHCMYNDVITVTGTKAHEMEDYPDVSEFCGEREFVLYCKHCMYNGVITVTGTKAHEMEDYPDASEFCGEREFELECKYCDYYEYVNFKGTGNNHSFAVFDELPETCTEDGWAVWGCEREGCDYREYEERPALGHNYNSKWTVLTQATCSQSGISVRACKRCAEIEALTVPAYGHHDNNGDSKCDDCGCVVEIPENTHKTHTYGQWITEGNISWRECTECGSVEIKLVTNGGDVEIEAPEQPDCEFEVDSLEGTDFILVEESVSANLGENWEVLKAFDINLKNSDGVHVQPDGTVKVKLPLDWEKDGNYKVYRVNSDGSFTDMEAYRQGSHMVFDTDHFSVYVIVEGVESTPDTPDTPAEPEQPEKEANVFSFLTSFLNNLLDFFRNLFRIG